MSHERGFDFGRDLIRYHLTCFNVNGFRFTNLCDRRISKYTKPESVVSLFVMYVFT